jgi:K+-sensing histidine kinase KdpD
VLKDLDYFRGILGMGNGEIAVAEGSPDRAGALREAQSGQWTWRLLGILATLSVALLDYATGAEPNVTLFYLAPLALASWRLSKSEAILASAITSVASVSVNYVVARHSEQLWIPFWNTIMLFGIFLLVVLILSSLRKSFLEQQRLISELQDALANVKTLTGLLPICSWCKKVRDDKGYWQAVEAYVQIHSDAEFSHGICPDCVTRVSREYMRTK